MIEKELLALVCTMALFASAAEPMPAHEELRSADGRYRVKIIHNALPGSDPVNGFYTLVVLDGERVISQFPTLGYLLSALWSPDKKYVAVNNRRANSGDYLWVISLSDGKAVKAPDEIPGEVLADRATRQLPNLLLKNFKKHVTIATGWADHGQLEIQSNLVFDNIPDKVVVRKASYRIEHNELIPIHEDFALASSAERPVESK